MAGLAFYEALGLTHQLSATYNYNYNYRKTASTCPPAAGECNCSPEKRSDVVAAHAAAVHTRIEVHDAKHVGIYESIRSKL